MEALNVRHFARNSSDSYALHHFSTGPDTNVATNTSFASSLPMQSTSLLSDAGLVRAPGLTHTYKEFVAARDQARRQDLRQSIKYNKRPQPLSAHGTQPDADPPAPSRKPAGPKERRLAVRWDQEEDVPAFHDVTADPLPIVKPVALAGAVSVASFRVVHINIALVTALAPNVKYLRLVATDEKGNASPAVSLDGARMHSAAVAGRSVKYAISVPDALGPIQALKLWLEADDKEHGWYVDTITLTGAGEEGTFHCGTDVFVGEHRAVVAERTRSSSDSDCATPTPTLPPIKIRMAQPSNIAPRLDLSPLQGSRVASDVSFSDPLTLPGAQPLKKGASVAHGLPSFWKHNLQVIFDKIDRDHSGLIEREEFEDALREMKKSEKEIRKICAGLPALVDFGTFQRLVRKMPRPHPHMQVGCKNWGPVSYNGRRGCGVGYFTFRELEAKADVPIAPQDTFGAHARTPLKMTEPIKPKYLGIKPALEAMPMYSNLYSGEGPQAKNAMFNLNRGGRGFLTRNCSQLGAEKDTAFQEVVKWGYGAGRSTGQLDKKAVFGHGTALPYVGVPPLRSASTLPKISETQRADSQLADAVGKITIYQNLRPPGQTLPLRSKSTPPYM